jgi:hypothetical protein
LCDTGFGYARTVRRRNKVRLALLAVSVGLVILGQTAFDGTAGHWLQLVGVGGAVFAGTQLIAPRFRDYTRVDRES